MLCLAYFAALPLTVCLAASVKRQTAVIMDFGNITSLALNLDSSINAFPTSGGTSALVASLSLHSQMSSLSTALLGATADATKNGPFTTTASQSILAVFQKFAFIFADAFTGIAVKQPLITAVPITNLAALYRQDISVMLEATKDFEKAILNDIPSDLLPTASPITSSIDAALATALAAYASG
ncbi:hypothetical protein BDP27DRAFT_1404097 [Rhodocollybia butyracea]|uniref:Uncharacterized protein n=1 Tax=Rhodocollybia butyracea TaxID=206335 RepID=A0A9P5U5P8_9AGAR|nr:hypothetical protein BDP27DRAFT_1404097 [Rhodocollybia butyracea]